MRSLLLLAALIVASTAHAHEMPKSAVLLDFRSQHVEADLNLPVDRLQIALAHDGTGAPAPDPRRDDRRRTAPDRTLHTRPSRRQ